MSETTLQKKDGGTESVPGWYIEFQAAVLKQLPRSEELPKELAIHWTRSQENLKRVLRQSLGAGLLRYPGMKVGPMTLVHSMVRTMSDTATSISDAQEVFPAGVDSWIKKHTVISEIHPKPPVFLDVYEVFENTVLKDCLPLLSSNIKSGNINDFVLPQENIIGLCRKYAGLLRAGVGGNYFFTQTEPGIRMIKVLKKNGGLQVGYAGSAFEHLILEKKNSPRLFVPSPRSTS